MNTGIINPFGRKFDVQTQEMRLFQDDEGTFTQLTGARVLLYGREGFSYGRDAMRYLTDPLTGPAFGNAPRVGGRLSTWERRGGLVGVVRAAGVKLTGCGSSQPAAPLCGLTARLRAVGAALTACLLGCTGGILRGLGTLLLWVARLAANVLQAAAGLGVGLCAATIGCWVGVAAWRAQ